MPNMSDEPIEDSPQQERVFYVYTYRYIDHSVGTEPDEAWDLLRDRSCKALVPYIKRMFRDSGWNGHGRIEVFQIPPVVLPHHRNGFLIWHTRNSETRTSYLATEVLLPEEIDGLMGPSHCRLSEYNY
jgi:hypothetical protein